MSATTRGILALKARKAVLTIEKIKIHARAEWINIMNK
jgi:hypothetical protein